MTIVLATDLRVTSRPFAELGAALAARAKTTLRLLHVSEDPRAPVVLGTQQEHVLGPVRSELEAFAAQLASSSGASVEPHLAAGPLADALAQVAQLELASMMLVGRGRIGSASLLGSVAERVGRKSRVPVLAVSDASVFLRWLEGTRRLRVLVGADLGEAAVSARTFAAQLAALAPAHVEVVMMASPRETHERLGLTVPRDEHTLSSEAEGALLRELERLAPGGERADRLRVVAARGSADAHLIALADDEDFDLVIVGQRQKNVMQQLWHGSVARFALRSAPMSVACVPRPLGARDGSFRPPCTVVVGMDFEPSAERALNHAFGYAEPGATVHLVHVLLPRAAVADARHEAREAHQKLAQLARERRDERELRVELHVLEGDPAEQLLALGERLGADLFVLGTRGRSGVARAITGSVAQSVLSGAAVPVLLVGPPRP